MFQFYYLISLLAAGVVFKGLEKMSPSCGILSYLPFHQSLLPLSIKIFFYIFPFDKSISPLPPWKNTMLPCIYGIFIVRPAASMYFLLICLHITQYWTFTLTFYNLFISTLSNKVKKFQGYVPCDCSLCICYLLLWQSNPKLLIGLSSSFEKQILKGYYSYSYKPIKITFQYIFLLITSCISTTYL